jgi:hypothetical protein
MTTLDATLRCNQCGFRLPGEGASVCPQCHAELAQVGVWSELRAWGATRRVGRWRYVWLRGVLGCGGWWNLGLFVGWFFGDLPWPTWLIMGVMGFVIGYGVASWKWRSAEREYAANTRPRQAEES